MMKNKTLLTTLSVIVIFVFLFIVYATTNKPEQEVKPIPQLQKVQADDHVKWGKNQKNILVEFTDFQCPACKAFHDYLKTYEASGSAESKVAQKITFVHKNFPLEQIHEHALEAAYAAEAAGLQNKFFEMGDMMFDNQSSWEKSKDVSKVFEEYAKQLKLDLKQFDQDKNSQTVKNKVNNDIQLGNQINISATPTFYLNGKQLSFATIDEFKNQLATAVK